MSEPLYRVVRFYESDDKDSEIILRGITKAEAEAHCHDPETSSSTATSPEAVARTERYGRWFDGREPDVEVEETFECPVCGTDVERRGAHCEPCAEDVARVERTWSDWGSVR